MLTTTELHTELKGLLGLVHHLMPPLNHRPELFHEQKDALAQAVATLINKTGGHAPTRLAFTTPTGDSGVRFLRHGGRTIPVERR